MIEDISILVLDDEEDNVEALLNYFNNSNVKYDYESDLESGAYRVSDSIQQNTPYTAIICDNHFKYSGLENYDTNFAGIDFLNILLGKTEYIEKGHKDIIKDFFYGNYSKLKQTYRGKLILFSGSAYFDSLNNPDLYLGIKIVQKIPDLPGDRCCCEEDVVRTLKNIGLNLGCSCAEIETYKLNNGLIDGIHHNTTHNLDFNDKNKSHEEMVKDFFKEHGTKKDIKKYC